MKDPDWSTVQTIMTDSWVRWVSREDDYSMGISKLVNKICQQHELASISNTLNTTTMDFMPFWNLKNLHQ